MIFEAIQVLLLAGIISTAFIALKEKDLLVSVVAMAAMSLLLSAEFYLLQAPDVAIAEAAIGAGLTTVVYITAIKKTSRWEDEK
ncbi:MAG: DUF4040 domain-containing protein [Candidatus Diapherotrites archaeon]|uniref:DUF4040 domain-containing protein n=1 Tax=Candidatus Iainarchaeum sp. TaxID=3101447 RepID=A0A938YTS9_9ARCH|nr:DUF4040 domain-containing protein [Candidatus Diapherotrites archaeon]